MCQYFLQKNVNFHATMTCEGCANAVKRILGKIEGVQSVTTDVAGQSIAVVAADSVANDSMLAALKKWADASGKTVELRA
jgi:copper chaperone CopZ